MSRLTFKYRLYPNRQQREKLQAVLDVCRELYNAALQERRDAWTSHHKGITYVMQANQLSDIKAVREDVGAIHSQVLQDALRRIDKTFKSFFLRRKRGQAPGFPRFRSKSRYDSFTYPQAGFKLNGRLWLSKIGDIKIKLHRQIKGEIKTLTIKRENEHWYACFSVVVKPQPLPKTEAAVGIDVGLSSFAVLATLPAHQTGLSDGDEIENPRLYCQAQKKLRRAQRKVARRKNKKSNHRRKAVVLLRKIHQHIFNQRNDQQHKLARMLVNQFGMIFLEDLNVKGLASGMLAKAVHDASWASFVAKLAYKAEEAGRLFAKVDPRGTSQRCPCGASVPKRLSDREHVCTACGLITTRDHASAMEILRLGLSLHAQTKPEVRVCVA